MNNELDGFETVTILTRNAIKCLQCNTVLESKYRHDFVSCNCPNEAYVDGGLTYVRCGAKDLDKVENLSEHKTYRSEEYQALLDERQRVYEQRMQERVALGDVVKVGNQYVNLELWESVTNRYGLKGDKK